MVGAGTGVWSFLHTADAGVSMTTQIRGISNDKARRDLGWEPAYPSWRDGFARGLSDVGLIGRGAAAGGRDREN